jgi:hypothetical protein
MEHGLPARFNTGKMPVLRQMARPDESPVERGREQEKVISARRRQRLLQIGKNVVDMLDADGQPHQILADSGAGQFRWR